MNIFDTLNQENEIRQIDNQIAEVDKKINELIYNIGMIYLANNRNTAEQDVYKDVIDMIKKLEANKKVYEDKKLLVKGLIRCKKCGNTMMKESIFCPKCGEKVENSIDIDLNQYSNVKVCKNCGKKLSNDAVFCTGCGNKVN